MLSLAHEGSYYQHFLAQGLCGGIGMGMMLVPALTAPSQYFRARRAVATGFVMAGGSLGAVVKPLILNRLFFSAGFGWAVRFVLVQHAVCKRRRRMTAQLTKSSGRWHSWSSAFSSP